ncbi:hypothetical protein [Rhizobium redzepovicii]
MRSMTNEPRAFRLIRERMAEAPERIRGFGMAIDVLDGYPHDARLLDKHAPALFVERVAKTEGEDKDRRRFGLVEYWADGTPPKSGLLRYVGDVFFADHRTAEFVWQAVIEKIENDAARTTRAAAGIRG